MSEISNYYNKLEVDNKLTDKVSVSAFTEANNQRITVDTRLENSLLEKLNISTFNTQIALKANISDIYNQQQINDLSKIN